MAQGKKTVTDSEIVAWMRKMPEPAFTTAEIAEEFNMTVEGMRGRLDALVNQGEVNQKKPTPRTVLWWADSD